MLIAQTFCNIHFIYVWNCKNSRCYKKLQLLLHQSRLAVLLILFFFGQKKSFLWQIWQKRLLWLKSILCNHNSVITLLSTHEIIHDYGTNYCNLRNLLDGTGISSTNGFLEKTSTDVCTQYDQLNCARFWFWFRNYILKCSPYEVTNTHFINQLLTLGWS